MLAGTLPETSEGVFYPLKCDLRKEEQILDVFSEIKTNYGGVDVCINVAGIGHRASILSGETWQWRDMLDVNVLAYAIVSREAVKQMRMRGVDDGHVILINSNCGHEVRLSLKIVLGIKCGAICLILNELYTSILYEFRDPMQLKETRLSVPP